MKHTLLLLATAALLSACASSTTPTNPNGDDDFPEIGGLLSITGSWNTLGTTADAAARIAINDLNSKLEAQGSSKRFMWRLYDTKLEANRAQTSLTDAISNGVRVVIGPQSSAEASAILSTANAQEVIVVSPSSTAGALAIENDNLLRMCPSDQQEGPAIAAMMRAEGRNIVVSVARDDIGNRGLASSVRADMKANGGDVVGGFEYAVTTTDFTAVVEQLRTEVGIAVGIYGIDKVAVYNPAFDEAAQLAAAIPVTDTLLRGVRWYGGDGTVESAALLAQAEFFEQVGYACPNVGIGDAVERAQPVIATIEQQTGLTPDAFALSTYDAVTLVGNTILELGNAATADALRTGIVARAENYQGISGDATFNAAGDRKNGIYNMMGIRMVNGQPTWVVIGTFDPVNGYRAE